ncbi:Arc family DNA-binding protein [Desulfotomaculum copahuensis]|uniref:Arc family DNA-binding protein n=1 Tax=Desulfotomaculum copahuensis TaxID=1838280 RepID=UPI000A7616C9|nr:Arc family DNA-binding protein [Desulfotomaculum copahuensis]
MTTYKKQFTLRLKDECFEKIKLIAKKNKRSIAMEIEYVLEQYIAGFEKKYGPLKVEEE